MSTSVEQLPNRVLSTAEPKLAQTATTSKSEKPAQSGAVSISSSDDRTAYEHQLQVRDAHMRRLQKLEYKLAVLGISADPAIETEAEDIRALIAEIDQQIADYSVAGEVRADRVGILREAQQREALVAISRITGIPADKIKLVDIVLGSVVLLVDMPLAGAARLVAMQRLNHPMLRAQGFANVALDRVVDTQGRPLNSMFDRAVRFEEFELIADTPSVEPSPYTGITAEARLRITLTENAARPA
jgi:hypothetical protein